MWREHLGLFHTGAALRSVAVVTLLALCMIQAWSI